jgi:hypothetical protein
MCLVNCKLTTLRISYGNGSIVAASRPDRFDPAGRVPPVFIRSRTGSGVRLDATVASHCTYNVTLRRARSTFVVVEKHSVLHILSVCL